MRERIMFAAMEEMNQCSIKFTMEDVARRLGISKRTLYENYSSKEELIGAIVDRVTSDFREKWQAVMEDDSLSVEEKLQKVITVRPAIKDQMNDRVAIDIKRFMPREWEKAERAMDEQWQMIEALLAQGVKEKVFRPVYFPAVRKMLQGAYSEIADYSFLTQNKLTIDEMIGHVTDILVFGLAARGAGKGD
ncbi:MAG: TetR/AcrR family transcriptional regulator [Negativicutes bacterium]|nr:TetR/AcrR family transcriptional regulator [Negativicutes bacterium]